MRVVKLEDIRRAASGLDLMPAIEGGFLAYSHGQAVVPPVGELLLDRGEVHIKYGFIRGQDHYVIKVASGFYQNPQLGLPTGNGLMLLFEQRTGIPVCLLQDEGWLTDVRTALAGAIAARYLAPRQVKRIGIVGTGVQARLQTRYLEPVTECREVLVWGRSQERLAQFEQDLQDSPFEIHPTRDLAEVQHTCNLIVTTTTSTIPLLRAELLQPGTHITAVGSDTPEKQELEAGILAAAHLVVADSKSQCRQRGEIHHALDAGVLDLDEVVELGNVICAGMTDSRPGEHRCPPCGRRRDDQITVADLTGVAVQDIQIADAVFRALA